MQERIFKDIPGLEGAYAATNLGEIWSHKTQSFFSPWANSQGYLYVTLQTPEGQKNFRVHRLIAQTFISNPEGKKEVDHINEDKLDNRVENLRWVTSAENKANSSQAGRKIMRTKVRCIETGEVFKSMVQAAEFAGVHRYTVNLCLLGRQPTAGGYHWERVLNEN